jgi:ABC-2 type transport system ATP-binding protein
MGLMHVPKRCSWTTSTRPKNPHSRANLWSHIRGLRDRHGTTILLTTHYLDEADALCDRILVIDRGRIVAEGTPDALKRRVSGDLVLVGAGEPKRVAEIAERIEGATELAIDDHAARFRVPDGASVLPGLLRELDAAGVAMLHPAWRCSARCCSRSSPAPPGFPPGDAYQVLVPRCSSSSGCSAASSPGSA